MNYKKILTILIIIIVACAGVYVFYLQRNEILSHKNESPTQNFEIKDKKITDNTKPFKIDITYPYIDGLDAFNKKVQDIINKELADFKKNSLDNDAAVKQVDPVDYAKYPREYDLNIGYTKGEVDQNIASVVFAEYNFEGGAHGASIFIPLNYDIKNNKDIKLADLFFGQNDYLKKISDFCIKDLTRQINQKMGSTEGSWINDGAGPKEENYSVFLINDKNIVFYFQQYQVAPGVAGDFEVNMNRSISTQ